MRNFILSALFVGAICANAQENYQLRVLTFEDSDYKGGENFAGGNDWSSLIDDPQFGGPMLYGPDGYGVSSEEEAYKWTDENNTWLSTVLSEGYGSWSYWSGGHAISHFGTRTFSDYGGYDGQLTVYNAEGEEGLSTSGNGHNGSDNFAMHYGYSDSSGWGLGEESLPALTFADGEARVIDHMYVNNSTYALNCYIDGNGLTAKIGEDDWVKVVATGYNGDEQTGTAEIYLCDGPENIIKEWTLFSLAELGKVTKVTFNIKGSSDNGYGFSQPAYFAYDDVAVRFPDNGVLAGVEGVEAAEDQQPVYYDLYGRRVASPTSGIYIVNGKKVYF